MTCNETIKYRGIEFDIVFEYQPGEAEVMYDSNMEGCPGCAERIDLVTIEHQGTDFYEFFDRDTDKIEEALYQLMADRNNPY